jgi:hypothetical protein
MDDIMQAHQYEVAAAVIACGLVLLFGISIIWVVWSRGLISGFRIGLANKNKPPRLVARMMLFFLTSTLLLSRLTGGSYEPNAEARYLTDACSIISLELFLLWIGYWILIWKRRIGTVKTRSGVGLRESDFEPLICRLISMKVRTDLMLFGSLTLGTIWWAHFAFVTNGNARLSRVTTLCGELTLGMLSLSIIALLSLTGDAFALRLVGLARLKYLGPVAKLASRTIVVISKYGSTIFIGVIGLWAIWVYFKEPFAPFDIFVLSIPLGLVWESAQTKQHPVKSSGVNFGGPGK